MNSEVKEYLNLFRDYNEIDDEKEKDIISKFLIVLKERPFDIYNEEDKKIIKDTLKELFLIEISRYGLSDVDIEFELDGDYLGNFSFDVVKNIEEYDYKNYKVKIALDSIVGESLNFDISSRLNAFKYLLKSLYHEIEHYIQFKKLTTNISSRDNLRFAREFVITDLKFEHDYDNSRSIYENNHNAFSIEADADYIAHQKISILLDHFNTSSILDSSVRKLDTVLGDINEREREELIDEKVSKLIKLNPSILDKLPILKKEFNIYGEHIDASSLITNMYNEVSEVYKCDISEKEKSFIIRNIYNMYYELIFNRIKENKGEIYNIINLIGENNTFILLNNIKELYRENRIFKSNLSKRKFDIRTRLDSKDDYLKTRGPRSKIKVSENGKNIYYEVDEYANKYLLLDNESDKYIRDAFVHKIPECGYFILKNGKKILPNDFMHLYLIGNVRIDNKYNDIMEICKEHLMSTTQMEHKIELERINSDYQSVITYIDRIIEEHDIKGEMKL